MGKAFTLKEVANNHSEFMINSNKAAAIRISGKKQAYICFGNKRHYVNVKISDTIPEENIMLSQNTIYDLHLPDYITYEIRANNNEILIGPYTGLLFSKEDDQLTEERLNKLMIYAHEYTRLNGALVVFALNKVDTANLLVEGYCYNPLTTNWQRGTFPYPSAIYRTIGLSRQWKNHFLSVIGDKVFNNRYFNKIEMYEWFCSHPEIASHLPYTIVYQSFNDVLYMLEKFGKIYIKPVSGLKGHGIFQISRKENSVMFKYRKGRKNQETILYDNGEMCEYTQSLFGHGGYLIQQSIDLLRYDGGIADFRCALQKNQSNRWECLAMFGRCGAKDSIVSNISSGGTVFVAEDLLKKILYPSGMVAEIVKKKIECFVLNVCNILDELGLNMGILGLDIGIDVKGHIWLIEINNRDPCSAYALDNKDEKLYLRLKTNPVFYAKALGGFQELV